MAVFVSHLGGDTSQPAVLKMEGNVIHSNDVGLDDGGLTGVVDVQSNTDVTIAFTTFADSLVDSGGRNFIVFDDVDINVYSSIFRESTGEIFFANWDADTTGAIDCALVYEQDSLPNTGETIVTGDPLFKDAADNDYRLRRDSQAVDFCDTLFYTPSHRDIEGQERARRADSRQRVRSIRSRRRRILARSDLCRPVRDVVWRETGRSEGMANHNIDPGEGFTEIRLPTTCGKIDLHNGLRVAVAEKRGRNSH